MSASAKTNYLIFAAFVAFLSISTLPQLSRGQSECFMVKWSLYFRGSRPKPKGTHKYRASLDIEFAQLSLRNIAMLAASVWFTCNIQSPWLSATSTFSSFLPTTGHAWFVWRAFSYVTANQGYVRRTHTSKSESLLARVIRGRRCCCARARPVSHVIYQWEEKFHRPPSATHDMRRKICSDMRFMAQCRLCASAS